LRALHLDLFSLPSDLDFLRNHQSLNSKQIRMTEVKNSKQYDLEDKRLAIWIWILFSI